MADREISDGANISHDSTRKIVLEDVEDQIEDLDLAKLQGPSSNFRVSFKVRNFRELHSYYSSLMVGGESNIVKPPVFCSTSSAKVVSMRDLNGVSLSFESLGSPSPVVIEMADKDISDGANETHESASKIELEDVEDQIEDLDLAKSRGTEKPLSFRECTSSAEAVSQQDLNEISLSSFENLGPFPGINKPLCFRSFTPLAQAFSSSRGTKKPPPSSVIDGYTRKLIPPGMIRCCDGTPLVCWEKPNRTSIICRYDDTPIFDEGDESPIEKPARRPPIFCRKCSTEHVPPYCPEPCDICYNPDHNSPSCPYKRYIPQGAKFDRVNYEIECNCGNIFNEDKWVCTLCSGNSPLLRRKYCIICRDYRQHCSYECPVDKVGAANNKAIRDYYLSRQLPLYRPK